MGDPQEAVVDRGGDLYVADTASMRIMVFDKLGRGLRHFGSRGRGEGQFLWMNALSFVGEDQLMVVDRARRVLSFWSKTGRLLEERGINSVVASAKQIRPVDLGRYLMLSGRVTTEVFGDGTGILSSLDGESLAVQSTFGRENDLLSEASPLERRFYRSGVFAVSGRSLLYAPRHYGGDVFGFEKDGDEWRFGGARGGFKPPGDAVRDVRHAPVGEMQFYAYSVRSTSRGGVLHVGITHETVGLFTVGSGDFVHFFTALVGGARKFAVQGFSDSGELKWARQDEGLSQELHRSGTSVRVLAVDERSQVYVLRRVGRWQYPEIRVIRMDLE